MMITLTGVNAYLVDKDLASLKAKLGPESDLGTTRIIGLETSLEDVTLELNSYSLFSKLRLIIIYGGSKIKGFDEYIQSSDFDLPASTILVLVEPSLDKRKGYFKFLQKNTDFRQFNKLSQLELVKWISSYVIKNDGDISTSDAGYLVERLGDDQLLLAQELDKLILYSKNINRKSIDELTEQSPSSTIFELLDAAFSLNPKKALRIYNEQRLLKVEPEQILAMLSWQLNTLAIYLSSKKLTSSQILSKSGLSPYTINRARQVATNLTLSNLKSFVRELANLDLASKTVNLDLDEGLKNFIASLSI